MIQPPAEPKLVAEVRSMSQPLQSPADLCPLQQRIGGARYVLLGEASHGTHEYYTWRAALSRWLIEEMGLSFVAVEGDWPDCYQINRYVKGHAGSRDSAQEVLQDFGRWPTWMWANEEIAELVEWLRQHNTRLPQEQKVGLYGLDVYSLWSSLYQVLRHLRRYHPSALAAARRAFQCFEPYGEDVREYARATRWVDESCEDEVVALLAEVHRSREHTQEDQEAHFDAELNALAVQDAERYYRTMVRGGPESWNVRDRHMVDALERLMRHHGPQAKAIIWEHNTHIGDARFTDMAEEGMVNVGQLVREGHSDEGVVLVGFGSHWGSVIAGREWEAPMERMVVPPAQRGSWEDVLHQARAANQLLLLHEVRGEELFLQERGQRAIGVVYHPELEHLGNYLPTVLPGRYDAFVYLNETEALRPLREVLPREEGEVPEAFPSGV
jgi:erythromycin esterase-like protein